MFHKNEKKNLIYAYAVRVHNSKSKHTHTLALGSEKTRARPESNLTHIPATSYHPYTDTLLNVEAKTEMKLIIFSLKTFTSVANMSSTGVYVLF